MPDPIKFMKPHIKIWLNDDGTVDVAEKGVDAWQQKHGNLVTVKVEYVGVPVTIGPDWMPATEPNLRWGIDWKDFVAAPDADEPQIIEKEPG